MSEPAPASTTGRTPHCRIAWLTVVGLVAELVGSAGMMLWRAPPSGHFFMRVVSSVVFSAGLGIAVALGLLELGWAAGGVVCRRAIIPGQ